MYKIFLILASLILIVKAQLIVDTQYGPIRGVEKTSLLNKTYYSFQKIPYMRAPLNSYRFRDPVPPEPWTAPLDCTQEGPRFPQIDNTWEFANATFRGELDSMHINLFTNNLRPDVKYPVLIWFHGGNFRVGSGTSGIYGPDYFMEREIIVVTLNYRLYMFGFISFDDPELGIPGNAGFKDQIMAMKWVKDNIANFGGDPDKITISGQLTGARIVHYHTISPASQGLFQRAIILSGNVHYPGNAVIPKRNWAYRLASSMGYAGPEVDRQILEFLEIQDPKELFDSMYELMTFSERYIEQLRTPFGPVIEQYDKGNAFLLSHPDDLVKTSWGNNIDLMIGAVSFEGGITFPEMYGNPFMATLLLDLTLYVPYQLNKTREEIIFHAEKLKRAYFGQVEPTPMTIEPLAILNGDFGTWHVYDRLVKQRLRDNPQAKNWLFRFDANSDNNCFRKRRGIPEDYYPYRRAMHQDEVCHLFRTSFATVPERGTKEFEMIEHMLDIFTNFATNGDPGVENWKPNTDSELTLSGYNIRENKNLSTFGVFPEMAHMQVWREMYPSDDEKPESDGASKIFISFAFMALPIILQALM